jgi:hypothetical protein
LGDISTKTTTFEGVAKILTFFCFCFSAAVFSSTAAPKNNLIGLLK